MMVVVRSDETISCKQFSCSNSEAQRLFHRGIYTGSVGEWSEPKPYDCGDRDGWSMGHIYLIEELPLQVSGA